MRTASALRTAVVERIRTVRCDLLFRMPMTTLLQELFQGSFDVSLLAGLRPLRGHVLGESLINVFPNVELERHTSSRVRRFLLCGGLTHLVLRFLRHAFHCTGMYAPVNTKHDTITTYRHYASILVIFSLTVLTRHDSKSILPTSETKCQTQSNKHLHCTPAEVLAVYPVRMGGSDERRWQ